MSVGDQPVQIFQSGLVLRQNDLVEGFQLPCIDLLYLGVQLRQILQLFFRDQSSHKFQIDLCKHHSVVVCPVMVKLPQLQVLCHNVQLMLCKIRQHSLTQHQTVYVSISVLLPCPACSRINKAGIEPGVVGNQHRILSAEGEKFFQRLGCLWSVRHHALMNSGQIRDFRRNGTFRVHIGVEGVRHPHILDLDGTDLREPIPFRTESRGFHIKNNDSVVDGLVGFSDENLPLRNVVNHIRLTAVDHLKILRFADGVHGFRERLSYSVIRNGNGVMSPRLGTGDEIGCRTDSVHGGHGSMHVQLHPLFRCIVHADLPLHQHQIHGHHGDVLIKGIELNIPLCNYRAAVFQLVVCCFGQLFSVNEHFQHNGAGIVGDVIAENGFLSVFDLFPVWYVENISPYHHLGIQSAGSLLEGNGLFLDGAAPDHQGRAFFDLKGQMQQRRIGSNHLGSCCFPGTAGCRRSELIPVLRNGCCNLCDQFLMLGGRGSVLSGQLYQKLQAVLLLNQHAQSPAESGLLQDLPSPMHQRNGKLVRLPFHSGMIQKAIEHGHAPFQLGNQ